MDVDARSFSAEKEGGSVPDHRRLTPRVRCRKGRLVPDAGQVWEPVLEFFVPDTVNYSSSLFSD